MKLLLNALGVRANVCQPLHARSSSKFHFFIVKRCPDMQHHLIKLCTDYTNTLNSQQVAAVDCSNQRIYALTKIMQCKSPEFSFQKYFALFATLHIETESLIVKRHLVVGTGLGKILSDKSIDIAGLKTAIVDVNYTHKASYYVQLSVLSIYTCLKKAHKASNFVLSLF